jgi:hypothetical protein
MKCKQIRSLIYDYEDGAVDKVAHSAIECHLSSCEACRLSYQTQRQLHQGMADAVSSELAGLHFKTTPIKEETTLERRAFLPIRVQHMALATSCFVLFCAATWMFWKPISNPPDNPASSAYAEAYHCLDLYRAGNPSAYGFTTPLAVIIQPGVPARIVELDGATNVSDVLK